jgi:DNA mismatch repair protein PMS2
VDGTSDAILSHADADDLPVPPQPLEVMRTVDGVGSACASFDITAVTEKWNSLSLYGNSEADPSSSGAASTSTASPNIFKPDDDEIATRQLSRVIHKEDFERMDVVGQFNRGFIIARNRGHTGAAANAEDNCGVEASAELNALDDLYIIDQHAADEKYNFEKLQAETKLESQRLFACVILLTIENLQQNRYSLYL